MTTWSCIREKENDGSKIPEYGNVEDTAFWKGFILITAPKAHRPVISAASED